jgi:hypothetical protein
VKGRGLLVALPAFILGASIPATLEADCIDYNSYIHWVGAVETQGLAISVAVAGNHAYVLSYGLGLEVVDVTNKRVPSIVGQVGISDESFQVVTSGQYAYVANAGSGLTIVDVSIPAAPSIVGSIDTPGSAEAVAVAGAYAFVADSDSGLQVIDVTEPASSLEWPAPLVRPWVRPSRIQPPAARRRSRSPWANPERSRCGFSIFRDGRSGWSSAK